MKRRRSTARARTPSTWALLVWGVRDDGLARGVHAFEGCYLRRAEPPAGGLVIEVVPSESGPAATRIYRVQADGSRVQVGRVYEWRAEGPEIRAAVAAELQRQPAPRLGSGTVSVQLAPPAVGRGPALSDAARRPDFEPYRLVAADGAVVAVLTVRSDVSLGVVAAAVAGYRGEGTPVSPDGLTLAAMPDPSAPEPQPIRPHPIRPVEPEPEPPRPEPEPEACHAPPPDGDPIPEPPGAPVLDESAFELE